MARRKRPSQASGRAQRPSRVQSRPAKKPRVVQIGERVAKAIGGLNPFD